MRHLLDKPPALRGSPVEAGYPPRDTRFLDQKPPAPGQPLLLVFTPRPLSPPQLPAHAAPLNTASPPHPGLPSSTILEYDSCPQANPARFILVGKCSN